ncbi:MAG: nuclear transport factor 2 family protein [Mycobacteriales bacterium]
MIKNVTSVTAETAAEVARKSSMADHPMIRLLTAGHIRYGELSLERLRLGIADDVVWYTPGNHPLSGRIEGIEGVFEWLKQSAEVTNGTFRVEMHRILADDEWAAVISTYRGERKGMVLEMPGVQTFRRDMDTNKIVEARIWVYDDVFVNKFWSA